MSRTGLITSYLRMRRDHDSEETPVLRRVTQVIHQGGQVLPTGRATPYGATTPAGCNRNRGPKVIRLASASHSLGNAREQYPGFVAFLISKPFVCGPRLARKRSRSAGYVAFSLRHTLS